MIDIVAWLRLQLNADAAEAVDAKRRAEAAQQPTGPEVLIPPEWHGSSWSPDRVLSELYAKRRFVERCAQLVAYAEAQSAERRAQLLPYLRAFEVALRDLAASYSDWPGYDPDWAPDKLQLDM